MPHCSHAMLAAAAVVVALTCVVAHAHGLPTQSSALRTADMGNDCRSGFIGPTCGVCDPLAQCTGLAVQCSTGGGNAQASCTCVAGSDWSGDGCGSCSTPPAGFFHAPAVLAVAAAVNGSCAAPTAPSATSDVWTDAPQFSLGQSTALSLVTAASGETNTRCGFCGQQVCCAFLDGTVASPPSSINGAASVCSGALTPGGHSLVVGIHQVRVHPAECWRWRGRVGGWVYGADGALCVAPSCRRLVVVSPNALG